MDVCSIGFDSYSVYHSTEDQIGTVAMILVIVQCIVLIASIIPTEHALKKTFDRNGNRI